MNQSRHVRNRVVLPKASLDLLGEINEHAEKLDSFVVIGMAPAGTELLGGKLKEPVAFYMLLHEGNFKQETFDETTIGFSKEQILEALVELAKVEKDHV